MGGMNVKRSRKKTVYVFVKEDESLRGGSRLLLSVRFLL